MRCILLAGLLIVVSGAAWANNPATITFGCAPWDGRAVAIKVGTPNAVYQVTLWDKGIKALESITHAVTVDNKDMDATGIGTGTMCVTDAQAQTKCTREELRIEVKAADFKAGSTVSGAITHKDVAVPFIGTVAARHAPCG